MMRDKAAGKGGKTGPAAQVLHNLADRKQPDDDLEAAEHHRQALAAAGNEDDPQGAEGDDAHFSQKDQGG
jgi:hypothetical protein